MNEGGLEQTFDRILVALDASPHSKALLDLAASLASCLESSLIGLFIEDQDILEFAETPIARAVSMTGQGVREISRKTIESHYRSQAAVTRRALESVAARERIECAFEVRRGKTELEISAAAREQDLVVISSAIGAIARPRDQNLFASFRSSSAAGLLCLASAREVLVPGPVLAIYTGSPAARRGLHIARRIATRYGVEPRILAIHPDQAQIGSLMAELTGEMADRRPSTIAITDQRPLSAAIAGARPRLILVPSDLPEGDRQALLQSGYPVLEVRLPDR